MKTQPQFCRIFPHEGVRSAWREGVAEAAQNPAHRHQLLHRERELLPRFATHYIKLKALPRRVRRSLQRKWKQSLAGVALLLALGQAPALAATINVGDTCTLADAINSANSDTSVGGCTAGSRTDTIVLPPSSAQVLTSVDNTTPYGPTGLPVISSEVTISGQGSTIRRAKGAPDFRILAVAQTTGDLTLRQTRVSGGKISDESGAGLLSRGALTVTNSTISGNTAGGDFGKGGGVANYHGTLIVTNSTISGNTGGELGGGVNSDHGTLTITNSTISNNTAHYGGGVNNYHGILTVTNSTISGNTCGEFGGGLRNSRGGTAIVVKSTISGNECFHAGGVYNADGSTLILRQSTISGNTGSADSGGLRTAGTATIIKSTISGNTTIGYEDYAGGVLQRDGTLTITNSTVSGNTARRGGGVFIGYPGSSVITASATITNSTISRNTVRGRGGGVLNRATLTLARTLISGNTASRGREVFNANNATVTAGNFNLFGHSDNAGVRGFSPLPTDIVPRRALRAILNTNLANNGGPTQTHALPARSPAVDAVKDICPPPETDQRGVSRPRGVFCDIGAFERRPSEP